MLVEAATQDAIRAFINTRNHSDALRLQRQNLLDVLRRTCTMQERRTYTDDLHATTSQLELATARVAEFTEVCVRARRTVGSVPASTYVRACDTCICPLTAHVLLLFDPLSLQAGA